MRERPTKNWMNIYQKRDAGLKHQLAPTKNKKNLSLLGVKKKVEWTMRQPYITTIISINKEKDFLNHLNKAMLSRIAA